MTRKTFSAKSLLTAGILAPAIILTAANSVKDPETLFLLSFDALAPKADAAVGNPELLSGTPKLAPGEKGGSAAKISGKDFQPLKYSGDGNISGERGEVEFDYQPLFAPDSMDRVIARRIFSAQDKRRDGFSVGVNTAPNGYFLWFIIKNSETPDNYGVYENVQMEKGKWYKIVASWDKKFLKLYINGVLIGKKEMIGTMPSPSDIILGDTSRKSGTESLIDNLRISSGPRAAQPDAPPVKIIAKDGSANISVSQVSDTPERFSFVAENIGGPLTLRVTPEAMPVHAGESYWVTASQFDPQVVWATQDGSVEFALPKVNYSAAAVEKRLTDNLVPNPSFEDRHGGEPKLWLLRTEENDTAPIVLGQDPAAMPEIPEGKKYKADDQNAVVSSAKWKSGGKSLRLSKTHDRMSVTCSSSQPVKLEPGAEYILSGYYSTDDVKFGSAPFFGIKVTADGKAAMRFCDESLSAPRATAANEWRRAFVRFKVPEDCQNPSGVIEMRAAGAPFTIFWDELDMSKAPAALSQQGKQLSALQKKPRLTAEEVAEMMKKRAAYDVKTACPNGVPQVLVDGKVLPLFGFAASPFEWPNGGDHKDFAAAGVHLHLLPVATGWNGHDNILGPKIWTGQGAYSFDGLDQRLSKLLGYDPDAKIMLYVFCDPYPDFLAKNPSAEHGGPDGKQARGKKTYSLSSEAFRKETADMLKALGAHLAGSDLGKAVIGAHLVCGLSRQTADGEDRSESARDALAKWLEKRFKGDKDKLTEEWGEGADFKTVAVPEEKRIVQGKYFLDKADAADKKTAALRRFRSENMAESICSWAEAFKAGAGRGALVTAHYGDIMRGRDTNNHALKILLESPALDGVAAPPAHGWTRLPGQTGGCNAVTASVRLHKKLFISELDARTEYSLMVSEADKQLAGAVCGAEAMSAQLRRDLGAAFAQGSGAWIYGIGGNGWLNPEYMETIAEAAKAAEKIALKGATEQGQIAVFFDEELFDLTSSAGGFASNLGLLGGQIAAQMFSRSGLTWDAYLLSDLENPARPKYKINIFMPAPSITFAQAKYVKEHMHKDGSITVVTGPAGAFGNPNIHEIVKEMTGVDAAMNSAAQILWEYAASEFDDPLAVGFKHLNGVMTGPIITVDQDKAATLAVYQTDEKSVAAGVKRHSEWTGVFMAPPGGLTPGFVRLLAKEAKLEPHAPDGDLFFAGNGVIGLHSMSGRRKNNILERQSLRL